MSDLADRLNAIHQRLIAGRPTASLELFEAASDPLTGFLRRQYAGMTKDDAHDHAVDAIVAHIDRPDGFDSSKSSLWTYLCMVAQRNIRDARRNDRKRGKLIEKHAYGIEQWGVQANNLNETVEIAQDAETIMRMHGGTIAKNEIEKKVLDLFLQGESQVALYAEAMGLEGNPSATAEVKRAQDRIKARLKKVSDEF